MPRVFRPGNHGSATKTTGLKARGTIRFIVVAVLLAGVACDSPEKYQKKTDAPSPGLTGKTEMRFSPAQAAWARTMAELFDNCKLAADSRDFYSAIQLGDSLVKVAEAALDTVDQTSSLHTFLLLYATGGCASLIEWETARGNRDAAEARTQRFHELASRLETKGRKDSL